MFKVILAFTLAFGLQSSFAQAPKPDPMIEMKEAWKAAEETAVRGPSTIDLLDQAKIKISEGEVFIKANEARRLLRAMGNVVSIAPVGLIAPVNPNSNWLVVVRFTKEGYINDEDAKNWKADEMLANIKEGTEAANSDRVSRGFQALEVIGWIEPPKYDILTNRLVWSLSSRDKGDTSAAILGVNYNTYALGRFGYFSMNLLSNTRDIAEEKNFAITLLNNLNYNEGSKYSDFNAATDNIASYGIAALVGAGLAKKAGLFAVLGVFILKFGKILLIPLIFGGGFLMRFFKKKQ